MRKYQKIVLSVLMVLITSLVAGTAAPQNSDIETDNLKAAFIYNFTKYITWPDSEGYPEFRIGVLGYSKITESLEKVASKKTVDGKSIEVYHFSTIQNLVPCQILFVSSSEKDNIPEIISALKNSPTLTLTIGDTDGFCERGIMINFFSQNSTIKFEMNPVSVKNAGLIASSQLQKLARIVP